MLRRVCILAIVGVILSVVVPVHADEDTVFVHVRQVLSETLGIDKDSITMDSSLTALGMTEQNKEDVKRNLEVQFGSIIPQDTFDQMSRVADVVKFFRGQ